MKRLPNVKTEISRHILAYNMKRVMALLGTKPLLEAIRA
jgi:transposase